MRTVISLVLAALIMPAGSGPQAGTSSQENQSVFKAHTRLVLVDVVATDSNGTLVTDLKEGDFTVLEDGRPQRFGSFSLQQPGAPEANQVQLQDNVITNAPRSHSSSLNVILLDRINGEASSHIYAQDRLVKFLETGAAVQPTAIFILGKNLTLVHDFTTDTKVLKDTLNKARPGGVQRVLSVDVAASPFATKGDFHTDEKSLQVTLTTLKLMAKMLGGYPGRKNLLWVSEAFPTSLTVEGVLRGSASSSTLNAQASTPAFERDTGNTAALKNDTGSGAMINSPENVSLAKGHSYDAELAELADALMDAHVALYPIDAAGMGSANRMAAQGNMQDMADKTGGKAFYNRNDIEVGIRSSIDDGSTYYAISYYPDNKTFDGRFRKIEVKANRPGINLRYRQGYYAIPPEASSKKDSQELLQEFAHALSFDAPAFASVRFRATVTPPAAKSQPTIVNFAIDPHSLAFETTAGGLQHVYVSCSVVAYKNDGSPVKGVSTDMTNRLGDLKPDDYQRLMQQYLPCKRSLDLKPGAYTLRLGAVDHTGRTIGTATAAITVN
jgi:VWFA-related protein